MGKTRENVRSFVNVADYRSVGDGISSSHQAFLDAIDVARVSPSIGNIVYVPEGRWILDAGAVPIYSRLEYRGAGRGRTILQCAGATTARLFQALSAVDHVRFADLTIDLARICLVGIEIAGCADFAAERIEITNGKDATGAWPFSFIMDPCSDLWIQSCRFSRLYREALSFGAGTVLDGGFLSHNRAITAHTAWLSIASPGTYTEPDNIVTENGITRITGAGGGGISEGAFTTPTLGSKWQTVPSWEVAQYYKHGQVVSSQGAIEVKPGQTVSQNEVVFTFDAGFRPAKPTPRMLSGFLFLVEPDGDLIYAGAEPLLAGTWIVLDSSFRLGGG